MNTKISGDTLQLQMKERKGKIILLPYGDFTTKDIAVLLLLFGVEYSRVAEIKDIFDHSACILLQDGLTVNTLSLFLKSKVVHGHTFMWEFQFFLFFSSEAANRGLLQERVFLEISEFTEKHLCFFLILIFFDECVTQVKLYIGNSIEQFNVHIGDLRSLKVQLLWGYFCKISKVY